MVYSRYQRHGHPTHCGCRLPQTCSSHLCHSPACRVCPPGHNTHKWCSCHQPSIVIVFWSSHHYHLNLCSVADSISQGAGPVLVTIPLKLAVTMLITDVAILRFKSLIVLTWVSDSEYWLDRVEMFYYRTVSTDAALSGAGTGAVILALLAILNINSFKDWLIFTKFKSLRCNLHHCSIH